MCLDPRLDPTRSTRHQSVVARGSIIPALKKLGLGDHGPPELRDRIRRRSGTTEPLFFGCNSSSERTHHEAQSCCYKTSSLPHPHRQCHRVSPEANSVPFANALWHPRETAHAYAAQSRLTGSSRPRWLSPSPYLLCYREGSQEAELSPENTARQC